MTPWRRGKLRYAEPEQVLGGIYLDRAADKRGTDLDGDLMFSAAIHGKLSVYRNEQGLWCDCDTGEPLVDRGDVLEEHSLADLIAHGYTDEDEGDSNWAPLWTDVTDQQYTPDWVFIPYYEERQRTGVRLKHYDGRRSPL